MSLGMKFLPTQICDSSVILIEKYIRHYTIIHRLVKTQAQSIFKNFLALMLHSRNNFSGVSKYLLA